MARGEVEDGVCLRLSPLRSGFGPGELRYLGAPRSAPFRYWEELGGVDEADPSALPEGGFNGGGGTSAQVRLAHTPDPVSTHTARILAFPGS